MSSEVQTDGRRPEPIVRGRFLWPKSVLWLPACLVLGVLVAWAAVVAQSYVAPLVLFPLLVGVGLGALIVSMMRLGQVGNRRAVLLGTVLAVAVTVVGQHYIGYIAAFRTTRDKTELPEPLRQAFSDLVRDATPSFAEFMRRQATLGRPLPGNHAARGWLAWLTWSIDGLLVLAAALAIVLPATRLPYCNRCQSWYRVTRSARVDVSTARKMAEVAGMDTADRPTSARYRLLACNGGCGPTRFEISWYESPRRGLVERSWLDAKRCNEIGHILDETR